MDHSLPNHRHICSVPDSSKPPPQHANCHISNTYKLLRDLVMGDVVSTHHHNFSDLSRERDVERIENALQKGSASRAPRWLSLVLTAQAGQINVANIAECDVVRGLPAQFQRQQAAG